MTISTAAAVARAHCEAWSNHDYEAARAMLADDVTAMVRSTRPVTPSVGLDGIDAYMDGLIRFAEAVVPGSLREIACVGEGREALLMIAVDAAIAPGGPPVQVRGARLYVVDDEHRIKAEQVVSYVPGAAGVAAIR